jgi:hypothetical protein
MSHGFYLYGIFPAPGPHDLPLEGLDQQPVLAQPLDGFVFLYSEAQQERYLASRKNLLGHERVLEQAMQQGHRTLLPIPFNRMLCPDWETVAQQFTQPYGDRLNQLFDKLDGHREVSVKVIWNGEEEQRRMMAVNQDLRQERDRLEGKKLRMDEVIRFGQATEQAMAAHREAIVQQFRKALDGLATDVVENPPQTSDMIYNAAFLIPWDSEPQMTMAIETLDRQFEERLRIRYNNFTAPYNFAQLSQN